MANHGPHIYALCLLTIMMFEGLCFHRFSSFFLLWSLVPTGGDFYLLSFVGGFLLLQFSCDSFCLPKFCGSNFHRKPPWLQTSKSLLSSFSFPLFAPWVLLPLPVKTMSETLRTFVQDLSLESDDDPIVFPREFYLRVASVNRFSLMATPVNPRNQNLRALIGPMPRIWSLTGSCFNRLIGNGRVQFKFQTDESMILVLQWGPGFFNDWMLSRSYPNIGDDEIKIIPFWVKIQGIPIIYLTNAMARFSDSKLGYVMDVDFDETVHQVGSVRDLGSCMVLSLGIRELLLEFKTRGINLRFENVLASPLSDQLVAPVNDCTGCDYFSFVMAFCMIQFGFCRTEMSNLHMGLVKFWRQDLVSIVQIWRLKNGLATFSWEHFDMSTSSIWNDVINLFVVMVKRITQSQYLKETLVRKCWCHYVSFSELALDTSALMLRFVKRSHSHKSLYTIRNKEKSNMKLDNNRSSYRLASKATLRKASSNSLLLFFLLVYGTYSCVCNNCVSLILYVFVITLLD